MWKWEDLSKAVVRSRRLSDGLPRGRGTGCLHPQSPGAQPEELSSRCELRFFDVGTTLVSLSFSLSFGRNTLILWKLVGDTPQSTECWCQGTSFEMEVQSRSRCGLSPAERSEKTESLPRTPEPLLVERVSLPE